MTEQHNYKTAICQNCTVANDNSILVSVHEGDKGLLLLCHLKVKNKLLAAGCPPIEINKAYKNFIENFGHFAVCSKGEEFIETEA